MIPSWVRLALQSKILDLFSSSPLHAILIHIYLIYNITLQQTCRIFHNVVGRQRIRDNIFLELAKQKNITHRQHSSSIAKRKK